jgi:phosphodiesterase/alkaline phosphatase D-like protein
MEHNPEEERYQCWAELTNLTPDTTYFVTSQVEVGSQVITGQTLKFRTGPALNSNQEITYVNGGDFAWTQAGTSLCKKAAELEPLFAIIGGDIAYENGDPTCYRRYDSWFKNWMEIMKTPSNYSIPILTAAGKHYKLSTKTQVIMKLVVGKNPDGIMVSISATSLIKQD